MTTLVKSRARCHTLLPRLHVRELLDVNPSPSCSSHPAPVRDIGDGNMVADEVSRPGVCEVLVENPIQPTGLIRVAVHAILDALGRVSNKVISLALHGTQARILEEEPVVGLVVLAGALGIGNLMLRVILLGQVLQDATRLEETDRLAIAEGVGQCGDATVGVDLEEPAE